MFVNSLIRYTMKKVTSKHVSIFLLTILIAVVSLNIGCKKDDDTTESPGTNEIWMRNTTFDPSTLTVSKGTTVKWINKDGLNHTSSISSSLFESGQLGESGTFSFKFDSTGTHSYFCKNHSSMTGKVIVK